MAALMGLFSRPSSTKDNESVSSTSCRRYSSLPVRVDSISVNWHKRSVSVSTGTTIGLEMYNHDCTSLSEVRKGEVARAVYLMTQLRRLRDFTTLLEIELEAHYTSFRSEGLLLSSSMPVELVGFLSSDANINSNRIGSGLLMERLTSDLVFQAAAGLFGLLAALN